jgi:hypothetical protein
MNYKARQQRIGGAAYVINNLINYEISTMCVLTTLKRTESSK